MNNQNVQPVVIPEWMVWVQCICFSVLYAIWALPETILVRHVCLILGAIIGIYEIVVFKQLFFRKLAVSAWLIITLFCWIAYHLLFLSNSFDLQYLEFITIWKRIIIGFIFALGFGLALSNLPKNRISLIWKCFYLGLLLPSIIYSLKYVLTTYEQNLPFEIPSYLKIYHSSAPYFVHKVAYVCFCFPVLAVAIGGLGRNLGNGIFRTQENIVYLITILLVLFIIYTINIKNIVAFCLPLLTFLVINILRKNASINWGAKIFIILAILLSANLFWSDHVKKNDSWGAIFVDAKIAMDTDFYDHWKYNGTKGYPINEIGKKVSPTNYDRIAWAKVGAMLLLEHPLGYGLVERSFGHLSKEAWPETLLHQSHSGWLDLTLGIGIPGVFLILFALVFNVYFLGKLNIENRSSNQYQYLGGVFFWILVANLLMWCTTEISQKVFFDCLIFMLSITSGFLMGSDNRFVAKS